MLRGMLLNIVAIAVVVVLIELLRSPVRSLGRRRSTARVPVASRVAL